MSTRRLQILIFVTTFILSLCILYPVVIQAGSHASHYKKQSWGYGKKWSYNYARYSGSDDWSSDVSNGVANWNSYSNASITYSSSNYGHLIMSGNYGNTGWYGITYSTGSIKLNNNTPSQNRRETVAHEIGHGLGLDHYNCNSELMRAKGFKGSPVPNEGDVNGVKNRW